MKISANRDDLLRPLQQIVGVVERRQTLPILANVLIGIKDNSLSLTATDLEVELRTQATVEANGEAEFTVPARKLMDIVKALPDGAAMTLEVEGDKAVLRSGRGDTPWGCCRHRITRRLNPLPPATGSVSQFGS